MNSDSRIFQLVVGAVAVVGALLLARSGWSFRAQSVVFVGFVLVVFAVGLRFRPRLPPGGVEATGPDEVAPGAEGFVHDFEAGGLRRVGAYRWALRGRLVISTVMATPDNECYAIVTDRVLELSSRFGERTLTTINRGRASLPADILRQAIRHGGPSELLAAHRAALDRLAERGLRPDRFRDDSEIMAAVRAAEERLLREAGKLSLATLLRLHLDERHADAELGYDIGSEQRIEAWLRARPEPGLARR